MHAARLIIGALVALALLLPAARAADSQGQPITLPAKERQVHVTYFRVPGDAPRPAALLLHGAGGFDSQIANYDQYCSELVKHGIDAYLVYYYSDRDQQSMSSGSDVFQSRYEAWARLVDDLADDVKAAKPSNGKVGLIGFSNGALLASGASALDPNIAAAVIYYGGAPYPMNAPVNRFPPLLILHGDADPIIPVQEGRRLAAYARQLGGTADLVIYPGEKHGFGARLQTQNGADALSRTIAFPSRELDAH